MPRRNITIFGGGLAPSQAAFAIANPGLYLNGSTNATWKAAVARVRSRTGRAKVVWKGDSTAAGQGGGTGAPFYLTVARPFRPSAVFAARLRAIGIEAHDNGIVGDNGMQQALGFLLPSYDPRVTSPMAAGNSASGQWGTSGGLDFAGGNYLGSPADTSPLDVQFTNVDTFEVVYYNSVALTLNFRIDGANPASGPSSVSVANTGGFTKQTFKASSVGTRTLRMWNSTTGFGAAVRSIMAYNSEVPAIDQLNHAALGSTSANQAATTSGWSNLDALGFDAPDLTIICLGYNDQNANTAFNAGPQAAMQAIITKAKLSGDVLLVVQPKATGTYQQRYAEYRAGVLALGVSNSVATLDLGAYFNDNDLTSRFADGAVHPSASLYSDEGTAYANAAMVMAS